MPEPVAVRSDTTEASAAKMPTEPQPPSRGGCRQPDFGFGLIGDVQWADTEDGYNFARTSVRHYRGAFQNLVDAVDWWSQINGAKNDNDDDDEQALPSSSSSDCCDEKKCDNGTEEDPPVQAQQPRGQQPLAFIGQLGDLLDGLNAELGQSEEALSKALNQLDRTGTSCPSINLIGNHELYNFDRAALAKATWLRHGDKEYYGFSPHCEGWRVVVLDSYQVSFMGFARADPRRTEAVEWLSRENPNISPNGDNGSNWFDGMPQDSHKRRFVPYNGGYGKEQLEWLRTELEASAAQNERVIVLSHVVMHPKALSRPIGGSSFAWDYDKALEILHSVRKNDDGDDENSNGSSSIVAAVLCGHDHGGGYHLDGGGIHHVTVASPLNKGSDGTAFGVVNVFRDGLEIVGPSIDDLVGPDRGHGRPSKKPLVGSCLGGGNTTRPLESMFLPFGEQGATDTGSRN